MRSGSPPNSSRDRAPIGPRMPHLRRRLGKDDPAPADSPGEWQRSLAGRAIRRRSDNSPWRRAARSRRTRTSSRALSAPLPADRHPGAAALRRRMPGPWSRWSAPCSPQFRGTRSISVAHALTPCIRRRPQSSEHDETRPRRTSISRLRVEVRPWMTGTVTTGSGMNSVSPGTAGNRPSFQSALACSIRSFELETKFHQMCRGPSIGSPPRTISRASEIALYLRQIPPRGEPATVPAVAGRQRPRSRPLPHRAPVRDSRRELPSRALCQGDIHAHHRMRRTMATERRTPHPR